MVIEYETYVDYISYEECTMPELTKEEIHISSTKYVHVSKLNYHFYSKSSAGSMKFTKKLKYDAINFAKKNLLFQVILPTLIFWDLLNFF